MVTCSAGSAVVINQKVFHGNFPNHSDRLRRMLAIAYRPVWAGPVSDIGPWNEKDLQTLPDDIRPLFTNRNTRHWDYAGGNKPPNMAAEAPGMDPSRWEH